MERLKELRLNRNLSQKTVASDLSIPQTTYSGYETGYREPDLKMLVKLAQYYGVSTDYLLGLTDKHE